MRRVEKVIDLMNEWLGRIVSHFLLFILAVSVIQVFMRYVFKRPLIWVWDVNHYLFASMIFLGAGYHLLHRQIIAVDVLYSRFSPKMKAFADLLAFIATIIFSITVIWKGWGSAWRSFVAKEVTVSIFAPPLYPLRALLPIGAILLLLQAGVQFTRDFFAVFKRDETDTNIIERVGKSGN